MPRRWLEGGPQGLAVHNTVAANYKNSYYKTTRLKDYMDYKTARLQDYMDYKTANLETYPPQPVGPQCLVQMHAST